MTRRVLGIDVGGRRIGLAISDPSRTLARPLSTLTVTGADDAVARVAQEIARLSAELARDDDGLAEIVVGAPSRLDGSPTDQTPKVDAFVEALRARTTLPIVRENERLTSREAESRLAVGERDWRRRKERLDAAAAAIILQDYLDRQ
jgi:putative Holliday junction resolvase